MGSLEPGKQADLLIIDPTNPATGPVFDPVAHIISATSSANIEAVYVAGKLRVKAGELLDHDMAALEAEVGRRVARIRAAAEREASKEQ